MSAELASSAAAAALNSASRPSRAAPVAATARMTCSPSSALRFIRSEEAAVVDVAAMDPLPPDIWLAMDVAQPVASSAMLARAQTDFTTIDFCMIVVLLGWDQFTRISPRIEGC